MGRTTAPQAIQSLSVNVTATEVQFVFPNRPNFGIPYFGGLYADLAQAIPTGTTSTLPVVFTSSRGETVPVIGLGNTPITAADIPGTGVYHLFYDEPNRRLQLLSPYVVG